MREEFKKFRNGCSEGVDYIELEVYQNGPRWVPNFDQN